MPNPNKPFFSLEAVPFHDGISRCVREMPAAGLGRYHIGKAEGRAGPAPASGDRGGEDQLRRGPEREHLNHEPQSPHQTHVTRQDSMPAHEWVEQRLLRLAGVFAIDVAAYAIVHGDCHVVLHVDKARALAWPARTVAERGMRIFNLPPLMRRFVMGDALTPAEQSVVDQLVELWRERLMDVRWLMRILNQDASVRVMPAFSSGGTLGVGSLETQRHRLKRH